MSVRIIEKDSICRFAKALADDEKSSATIKKYLRDLKKFELYLAGSEINKETVISYKKHLMQTYAPGSVNSMLAAVNRYLKEMGWHDCTVKTLKVQRCAFRVKEKELTKKDYFCLLDTAKKKGKRRLELLLQTICATGIRVSELSFITVEAVNSGVALVTLKGKMRQVLLPKALRKELMKYINEKGISGGPVFVTRSGKAMDRSNILHEMKALCADAGIDRNKVYPHNLRHLFACTYYEKEKDLCRLADILGHSNINTTRIYTSVSGSEQQLQIDTLGLLII